MKRCPHCGGMLLRATASETADTGAEWMCHNDYCSLNAGIHQRHAVRESIAVAVGWCIQAGLLALVVGAAYGLWLLVRS